MTLVELLVVIAIIGVLMMLMLSAVQASRERARKTICLNHLKQLAAATQLHVDAHGFFPSGGWSGHYLADPQRGYGRDQPGGWLFGVLEYLEESSLRTAAAVHKLDDFPLGDGLKSLFTSAPSIFYCPSRREARPYPFKQDGNGRWSLNIAHQVLLLPHVTKSDYAANSGDSLYSAAALFSHQPAMWVPANYVALEIAPAEWTVTSDPTTEFFQTGISYYRSEVRPSHVLDGLSKTYLCGEKFLPTTVYYDVNETNANGMLGDNQSAWVGYEWDNHRVAWNPASTWDPEQYQPQQDSSNLGAPGIFAFGSAHSSSLNMAYCDGSVQTVDYEIDRDVHRRQANRLDGD
jgi:prepilin-type processing-associated H-X9-DG protein